MKYSALIQTGKERRLISNVSLQKAVSWIIDNASEGDWVFIDELREPSREDTTVFMARIDVLHTFWKGLVSFTFSKVDKGLRK